MTRILALGLLSVGFLPGCKDAKGSPPPGCGSPGQVVWVDAAGTCVPGVVASSELYFDEKNFFDDSGHIWNIDVQSGRVSVGYSRDRMFESADCTGTAYISPTPPRVTFLSAGDDTIRVLPDDAQRSAMEPHSWWRQGGCEEVNLPELSVVPAELTIPNAPLTIPTLPYRFPLHAELVR